MFTVLYCTETNTYIFMWSKLPKLLYWI